MTAKKTKEAEPVAEVQKDVRDVKGMIISVLMKTGREGMEDLLDLMEETGFFTAPASTGSGRHSAEPGGLAEHSLNVYETAVRLSKALISPTEWDKDGFQDSLAVVCLLHDLGKMGDHGKQLYVPNILKSGKQSDAKPWERNKELANIPHAFRSVIVAGRWIDLSEDEEYAIMYHDGLYDRETGGYAVIQGHETKLLMILHWADMWASRVLEGEDADGCTRL